MKKPLALGILGIGLAASGAMADGTIYYGSRVGMEVDVVSMTGLNTSNAVIQTKHTPKNAARFCREYAKDKSKSCIESTLATRLNNEVTGNCKTGEFTDFYGHRYRMEGRNTDPDSVAKFRLVDLATNEVADGSSASGYPTSMQIFAALCPATAPREADF